MSTNKYVDPNIVAGKITAAAANTGARARQAVIVYEKTAADTDASILRFIKGLSPDDIIVNCKIANDALAGFTAIAVGFYGVLDYDNVGAIVGSGNQLAAALDLHSATISGSEVSAMTAVDIANRGKRIYELCGHTQATKLPAYDLALTLTTGGTATGTIMMIVDIIPG